jgi:hypothetical protein
MNEKKAAIKQMLFAELSRREFWIFCRFYDSVFFDERPFLEQVANAFQEIEEKKINKIILPLCINTIAMHTARYSSEKQH